MTLTLRTWRMSRLKSLCSSTMMSLPRSSKCRPTLVTLKLGASSQSRYLRWRIQALCFPCFTWCKKKHSLTRERLRFLRFTIHNEQNGQSKFQNNPWFLIARDALFLRFATFPRSSSSLSCSLKTKCWAFWLPVSPTRCWPPWSALFKWPQKPRSRRLAKFKCVTPYKRSCQRRASSWIKWSATWTGVCWTKKHSRHIMSGTRWPVSATRSSRLCSLRRTTIASTCKFNLTVSAKTYPYWSTLCVSSRFWSIWFKMQWSFHSLTVEF